jgi:hypothetical protein
LKDVPMLVFCIILIVFGAWFTASLLAVLTRTFR